MLKIGDASVRIINPPLLFDVLERQAQCSPEKIALEFEGRSWTYLELDVLANRTANYLLSIGLEKGDRLAWLATNVDLFWPVFMGASRAGIVIAPLNWRLAPAEITAIVEDMSASALMGEEAFLTGLGSDPGRKAVKMIPICPSLEESILQQGATAPKVLVHADDTVLQLYTSGTTGLPKGVLLTHRCFEKVAESQFEIGAISPSFEDEVILHVLPHFHIAGVTLGLLAWKQSMPIIQHRSFDTTRILDEAGKGVPINTFLVPAMIHMLVDEAEAKQVPLTSFVCVSYGAAPMPQSLLEKILVAMPNASFYQFYGMTETTGGLTVLGFEDHVSGGVRLRSAGKPIPGCEVKIVDSETGDEVPRGAVGEVITRSGHIMAGYWNLENATSDVICDGFYKTGDAGFIDECGYIYLVDRIKDMIISGGENIYPAELENILDQHPQVSESACFGVPHDKWGEAVWALVVPASGANLTMEEIVDFLSRKIAKFKLPHTIEFGSELPRNASGKVLKNQLRDKYRLKSE